MESKFGMQKPKIVDEKIEPLCDNTILCGKSSFRWKIHFCMEIKCLDAKTHIFLDKKFEFLDEQFEFLNGKKSIFDVKIRFLDEKIEVWDGKSILLNGNQIFGWNNRIGVGGGGRGTKGGEHFWVKILFSGRKFVLLDAKIELVNGKSFVLRKQSNFWNGKIKVLDRT